MREAAADPLGGALVDRLLAGEAREAARERAAGLPTIMIDHEAEIALEMIATGVFSPLTGSLTFEENESVLTVGRLPDETPWPLPLSFAPAGRLNARVLRGLQEGDEVALIDRHGDVVALHGVTQLYHLDRAARARGFSAPTILRSIRVWRPSSVARASGPWRALSGCCAGRAGAPSRTTG
ncbi:MAG: hypothetical protein M5U22_12440 [Thermoleophilia bacterium]|nr:hypothetical protein [Thermoleophilia bacterium]